MGAKRWSNEELDILNSYYSVYSIEELKLLLPYRSISSINEKAKFLGLRTSNKLTEKKRIMYIDRHNKYINEKGIKIEFFNTWSSEMAWVLGVITSDGALHDNNSIRLTLNIKDYDCVEKVRNLIAYSQDLKFDENNTKVRLSIGSIEIFTRLGELGVTPRKSLIVKPPNVPDIFIRDYIRGVFDGDGSIYIKKNGTAGISFSGNKYIINYINSKINQLVNIPLAKVYEKQKNGVTISHSIYYNNFDYVLRIGDFLYKDCSNSIYMDRKYLKLQNIKKLYLDTVYWKKEEDNILSENFKYMDNEQLQSLLPKRTKSAIQTRALELGLSGTGRAIRKSLWQPYEDEIILKYYKTTYNWVENVTAILPHRSNIAVIRRGKRISRDFN